MATIATTASRSMAVRSVHLKFYPRPRNLTESRQILRVIQRYGEVDVFKHLKYEPTPARNSAIAVFRSAEAATQAITASPVRFTYGENSDIQELHRHEIRPAESRSADGEQPQDEWADGPPEAGPDEDMPDTPITLNYPPMTVQPRPRLLPPDASPSSPGDELVELPPPAFHDDAPLPRPCTIHIEHAQHAHFSYIRRQHYHGRFKADAAASPGTGILGPLPAGLEGLANTDLFKPELPLRVRYRIERELEKEFKMDGKEEDSHKEGQA